MIKHNNLLFTAGISAFCATILFTCYFYGIHLGLNTRVTAGVELDANSISIALSRLWFHLHEGYVGYQKVYAALFQVLVPDLNPNNVNNFYLLSDPHALQAALDNVRSIVPGQLPHYSVLSPEFVSIMMEDLGLADYYTLAFIVFGVHAASMYKLYFALLALSVGLFIIEYRKQFFPMLLLGLILSIFPVFFFSDLFNFLMPSVNANRFLSTLGFIPITYALCIYFKPEIPLNRMQIMRLICQGLLFAFALSIRRSAQWQLMGLVVVTSYIAFKVYWPYRHSLWQLERLRLLKHPMLAATLIFLAIVTSYQSIQGSMMNPIYHTDTSPAGHAFWHSAYVGLAIHPDWTKVNPSITAATDINDGIALIPFERYMRQRGLNPLSDITHTYLFGAHEIVTKQEFLRFINKHKLFTLELYSYYKPKAIVFALWTRIKTIPLPYFIYFLLCSVMFGIILSTRLARQAAIQPKKFALVSTIFFLASCIPGLFAYPRMENGDDLWMLAIFVSFNLCMGTYAFIRRVKSLSTNNTPLSSSEAQSSAI